MENSLLNNNKFIYRTSTCENEVIPYCCVNCYKTEIQLYHCTNLNCNSFFCKNCVEKNSSNSCLKCHSGKVTLESDTEIKVYENNDALCNFCKKSFVSQKELKNHHLIECELVEVICPQCNMKFPKIQFKLHLCNPINNSLRMVEYLKDANQNLIHILGNFTNYCNRTEKIQTTLNTNNNVVLPTQSNEEILPHFNNLNTTLARFTLKIEDQFTLLKEEIRQIKQDKNNNCIICETKNGNHHCVSCLYKVCESCVTNCKICSLFICNKCQSKFENCKKDCKNIFCKNCHKLMNNKKFKIVESEFEKENLCTKQKCYQSKSAKWVNRYTISLFLVLILFIYLIY